MIIAINNIVIDVFILSNNVKNMIADSISVKFLCLLL